jgi:hypothetical protein
MVDRMILATQIWFVDLHWWAFWPLVAAAVIAVGLVLLMGYDAWYGRRMKRREARAEEYFPEAPIYPHYVEEAGVRELAETMKFQLPTARQITRSKKLSLSVKGAGGERGDSQTEEFGQRLPLRKIARKAEEAWEYEGNGPAGAAADAVSVSDERALSTAVDQLRKDFPTTSQTAELLSRIQEVFNSERVEALAEKKREEFESIGEKNRMLVLRGQFAFKELGSERTGPRLALRSFNPTPGYVSPRGGDGDGPAKPDLIPVPEGVGLEVVLPDQDALTPSGSERILRGEPFYAGLIAHSPSFDRASGVLTCSAWAIWGEQTPEWNEAQLHGYRCSGYYR